MPFYFNSFPALYSCQLSFEELSFLNPSDSTKTPVSLILPHGISIYQSLPAGQGEALLNYSIVCRITALTCLKTKKPLQFRKRKEIFLKNGLGGSSRGILDFLQQDYYAVLGISTQGRLALKAFCEDPLSQKPAFIKELGQPAQSCESQRLYLSYIKREVFKNN